MPRRPPPYGSPRVIAMNAANQQNAWPAEPRRAEERVSNGSGGRSGCVVPKKPIGTMITAGAALVENFHTPAKFTDHYRVMNAEPRQSSYPSARPGSQGRAGAARPRRVLTAWQKRVISGVILLHLVGVVAGPLAAPPSSELFSKLWDKMQWYVEPMFLNHGYRFFGPDPGPSHLVEWEVELPDGSTLKGDFPNLNDQQPRLFYHRHFMLSERLQAFPDTRQSPGALWMAGAIGGLSTEGGLIDLPGDPAINALARSYARHLYHKHGAKRVRLTLVRHLIPEPDWVVRDGMKLNDPELYRRWPLAEYTEADALADAGTDAAQQGLVSVPLPELELPPVAAPEEVRP